MKPDSNRTDRRIPTGVLFLTGVMVGCPFFLLAFALSPVGGTWLMFVIPALLFAGMLTVWLWSRRTRSHGPVGNDSLPIGA
ncbi:MAG TPA: hypothetical protein VIT67_09090 [Povalibacter sp.]